MKDYQKIVGINIKALRKERDLTQEQLARRCGNISDSARSWISKIESGQRATYTTDIGLIASALDVMPAVLFVDYDTPNDAIRIKRLLKYNEMLVEQLQHDPTENHNRPGDQPERNV